MGFKKQNQKQIRNGTRKKSKRKIEILKEKNTETENNKGVTREKYKRKVIRNKVKEGKIGK